MAEGQYESTGQRHALASPQQVAASAGSRMAAPVCAIIVAGGTGSRFGNPGGKQLVMVEGRPLVSWCIAAFDRAELVGHIVVVCPQERRCEMARDAVEPFGYATPVTYADAGSTRQDSTRAGLDAVPEGFSYVAVHDGARPLIKPQTIDSAVRVLMANSEIDGVVCGQPAIDTLKRVEPDGRIIDTPPRSQFWTVQTPQIFTVAALRHAFEVADRTGFVGTDDASLVERAGGSVLCVESPRDNIKVTVPEDLAVVAGALRRSSGYEA